jgi:hypothetical protein
MHKPHRPLLCHLLSMVCALLAACASSNPAPQAARPTAVLATPILVERVPPTLPSVAARQAALRAAVRADPPVLRRSGLDATAQRAQELALADARVRATLYISTSTPLRSEVFGVVPAAAADLAEPIEACASGRCYKVVIFIYTYNRTVTAIVSPEAGAVVSVSKLDGVQPDVPPDLAALAVEIARAAPAVQRELQMVPPAEMATMEATKTALNGSACERSRHLCVAPTFVWGERALWAIVDLTDLVLVGVQWTDVGASSRRAVTEASMQNDAVSTLCDRPETLKRGDWSLSYSLSSSDGLVISDVAYAGKPVLRQAKLVDWHVSYSINNGFGYSDGVGCPTFSTAVVVPFNPPAIEPIRAGGREVGFALVQDYRTELWPVPCNYRYQNRYEFYADGRLRVAGVNIGRGCGITGVYRPLMRIVPATDYQTLSADTGDGPRTLQREQWLAHDTRATTGTLRLGLALADGRRYTIATGADAAHPDESAFVYLTRHHSEEGDADLASLGMCCSTTFEQGPEQFIGAQPEPLDKAPLAIWYVPELRNAARERCWADARLEDGVFVADTWPCSAGPTFIPAP